MASVTVFNVTYVTTTNPCHSVHMYWTVLHIIRYICTGQYCISFGTYVLDSTAYIIQYVCAVSKCRFTAISSLSPSLIRIPWRFTKTFLRIFGIYQTICCHTHIMERYCYWPSLWECYFIYFVTLNRLLWTFHQIQHSTHKFNTTHINSTQHTSIQHNTHKFNTAHINSTHHTSIQHSTHQFNTAHINSTQHTSIPHNTHKFNTAQIN